MFLVSACLAGFNTRYDGKNSKDKRIVDLVSSGKAIPVCPEQLGSLPTPRRPLQFMKGDGKAVLEQGDVVIYENGTDYTDRLIRGAKEILRIADMFKIKKAIFKDGSPSCGVHMYGSLAGNRLAKV